MVATTSTTLPAPDDLTLGPEDLLGWIATPVGNPDVYTAPKLRDQITELVADGRYQIVIDMAAVEFLDSTGLGVLVGVLAARRAVRPVADASEAAKAIAGGRL